MCFDTNKNKWVELNIPYVYVDMFYSVNIYITNYLTRIIIYALY